MTLGLAFWIVFLIALIFSSWRNWPDRAIIGGNLVMFVLFALLGWRVFGAPIHG